MSELIFRKIAIRNYRSIVSATLNLGRITVVIGPTDSGKCLGRGTPVLMVDGRTVNAEDVRKGDRLMGPDGSARRVLATTKGCGKLYRVIPRKGDPWVCNEDHVLTTVRTDNEVMEDVSIREWFSSSAWLRTIREQFSVGVDSFENNVTPPAVDPYFLGVWFGDGTKTLANFRTGPGLKVVSITNPEPEVIDCCREIADRWGLKVRVYEKDRCPMLFLFGERGGPRGENNQLLKTMRKMLGGTLTIPDEIMRGSRAIRLQFLAGFLDTDGTLGNNCFSITQKREDWARAVWWLARSLGLTSTIRKARAQGGLEGIYWRVHISGHTDQIPTRIPRKQARSRKSPRTPGRTGITVEPIGKGEYFGFTLDGDGRFLLGDFTVTHNSNLVRAIRDWAYYSSSVKFITAGHTNCRIAVAVRDRYKVVFEKIRPNNNRKLDPSTVITTVSKNLSRASGGRTRYVVRDGETGQTLSYERIGRKVPNDVSAITEIRPIQIDEKDNLKVDINVAEQDEGWFLVGRHWTPSMVSRVIGKMSGIDALILASREVVANRVVANREVANHERWVSEGEENLREFDYLNRATEILEEIDELLTQTEEDEESVSKVMALLKTIRVKRLEMEETKRYLNAVRGAIELVDETNLLTDFDNRARIKDFENEVTRRAHARDYALKQAQKAQESLKEHKAGLGSLAQDSGLLCPLCGLSAHKECRAALEEEASAF